MHWKGEVKRIIWSHDGTPSLWGYQVVFPGGIPILGIQPHGKSLRSSYMGLYPHIHFAVYTMVRGAEDDDHFNRFKP